MVEHTCPGIQPHAINNEVPAFITSKKRTSARASTPAGPPDKHARTAAGTSIHDGPDIIDDGDRTLGHDGSDVGPHEVGPCSSPATAAPAGCTGCAGCSAADAAAIPAAAAAAAADRTAPDAGVPAAAASDLGRVAAPSGSSGLLRTTTATGSELLMAGQSSATSSAHAAHLDPGTPPDTAGGTDEEVHAGGGTSAPGGTPDSMHCPPRQAEKFRSPVNSQQLPTVVPLAGDAEVEPSDGGAPAYVVALPQRAVIVDSTVQLSDPSHPAPSVSAADVPSALSDLIASTATCASKATVTAADCIAVLHAVQSDVPSSPINNIAVDAGKHKGICAINLSRYTEMEVRAVHAPPAINGVDGAAGSPASGHCLPTSEGKGPMPEELLAGAPVEHRDAWADDLRPVAENRLSAEAEEARRVAAVVCRGHQRHASDDDEDDDDELSSLCFMRSLLTIALPPRAVLLPPQNRSCQRKTLVLDLDETLVHSTLEVSCAGVSDFTFPVMFNCQQHMVYVRRRPHMLEFMQRVAALYEVVVFTASQKVYADQLLDLIDPEHSLIRHRMFRDSCVEVDGNYLKDLSVLGRDLRNTLIVDNSPQAFGFQIDNGVPIESWYDDASDQELLLLLPFLESLVDVEDVRPHIQKRYRLKERMFSTVM